MQMERVTMIGFLRLDWKAYKNSIRGANQQQGCLGIYSEVVRLGLNMAKVKS